MRRYRGEISPYNRQRSPSGSRTATANNNFGGGVGGHHEMTIDISGISGTVQNQDQRAGLVRMQPQDQSALQKSALMMDNSAFSSVNQGLLPEKSLKESHLRP